MFKRLLGIGSNPNELIVDALYEQIVAAARQPAPYADWAVPDTPLGRFELLSLVMILVLRRLKGEPGAASDVAQDLVDTFFRDMDHSIRELGVGDVGVPKRMKKLSRMFYGRAQSYGSALDARDEGALKAALSRNVQPAAKEWPQAGELARYAQLAADALAGQETADIVAGRISFPATGAAATGEAA
ncbi:MAG: ubiquinol-cytochrome C chaperone [Rhizobiaceae bacterium]|nr:ubiquinol-cytochrome C chaperone [Rhizobiaceae bacterium]